MEPRAPQIRRFWPSLVFISVNPRLARKYLLYCVGALGLSVGNASLNVVEFWDSVLKLAESEGLAQRFDTVQDLHYFSLAATGAATALLIMIILKLNDSQLILDLAEGLLYGGLFALFIAWLALPAFPPGFDVVMIIVAGFVIVSGILLSISRQGKIGYYWAERSYGDASLGLATLILVSTLPVYSVWVFQSA